MSDTQPLWTDENIYNDAKRASSNPTVQAQIRACLLFMRHGYEARLRTVEAERDKLRQQLRDERHMFEDLTPGGSEFHDSPRNVLRWIEQQLNSSRISTIKALKQERDEARQELVECRARLSGTEAAGEDIEAMMFGDDDEGVGYVGTVNWKEANDE